MRLMLTALVLALAASTADAQVFGRNRQQQYQPPSNCPGGVCLPASPGAEYELWNIDGKYIYKLKPGAAAPKAMEAASPKLPAPKFAANPEAASDRHGRMFYRVVKDRVFGQLVDRGVPREKARKLVDTLSNESVDVYAAHVRISEGIGDGKILDWLIDHRAEILALIELIVKLLAVL